MTNPVEFLDLDEAVPTLERVVKLGGVEYPFKEPDVSDFAVETSRLSKMQKQIKKLEGLGDEERESALTDLMMKMTVDGIRRAFPTMTEEVVNGLNVRQIAAIREFIQAEVKEASKEAEDSLGNGSATRQPAE